MPALPTRLRYLLLGDEPRRQLRASQSLLALAVYLGFSVVQVFEVRMNMVDAAASWYLTLWDVGGGLGFYLLIRGGLAERVKTDRALTVPQSLWAMAGIAWSYAIIGPARGAVLPIMMLVILFGMFSLRPGQARLLAGAGFSMLAFAMVWKTITDPLRYELQVEAVHMISAGIVMASVAELSVRIGKLRARLVRQRAELAAALERIQALATRDELTGLLNRRAVLDRLQMELRDPRDPPCLCVALIDLDHFKRVNDNHGHAAGDEVLRRFAEVARGVLRADDVIARWGGEEFLLVMVGAGTGYALDCLARIRARLGTTSMDDIHPGLALTFSAGVSECGSEVDVQRAIERADRAMYEAKSAGRDRAIAVGDPRHAAVRASHAVLDA